MLGRHPGILTTAVVGIPDARWGETVGAFIERQPGSEVSNRDVRLWLRSRLAAHQIPEHILWIGDGGGVPDRVPVNASGKVMKTELRRIADDLLLKD